MWEGKDENDDDENEKFEEFRNVERGKKVVLIFGPRRTRKKGCGRKGRTNQSEKKDKRVEEEKEWRRFPRIQKEKSFFITLWQKIGFLNERCRVEKSIFLPRFIVALAEKKPQLKKPHFEQK